MEHEANTAAIIAGGDTCVPAACACATPAIDLAELRQLLTYFPGDRIDLLLDRFAAELARCNLDLRGAIAAGDLTALSRCVHNIRGTALTSCFVDVAELCDGVRGVCKAGDVDGARQLGSTLAAAIEAALSQLDRLRRSGAPLR